MKYNNTRLVLSTTLVILLAVLLASCSDDDPGAGLPLEDIVEQLYEDVDVPPYEIVQLDESNFEYFSFIPYKDTLSGVAADALVNVTPHSMVLVRTEKGNGAALAEKLIVDANPNKWLCVGSETVNVAYTDHYIVLVMSDTETANAIVENFRSLSQELDGMDMKLFTTGNSRYDL